MKIFNPITTITPAPDFVDGFSNLLTRLPQATINSAGFTPLQTFLIPPKVYNLQSQFLRLTIDYFGQFLGAAGNKQLQVLFDATVLHDSGLAGFANTNYRGSIYLVATINANFLRINSNLTIATSATGAIVAQQQFNQNALAFDSNVQHTITFQALAANPADSVSLDYVGGIFI